MWRNSEIPRRNPPVRWGAALLLLLLCFPGGPGLAAGRRQAKQAELGRVRRQIQSIRQQLNEARGKQDAVTSELRDAEQRIGQAANRLRTLDSDLDEQKAKLASLQRDRGRFEGKLQEQRGYLARQVRTAYLMGRQEQLKILLNQEKPERLGRVMAYYGYLSRERSDRIRELKQTLTELSSVQESIAEQGRRLERTRQHQLAAKQELEHRRQVRAAVLRGIKAQIRNKDKELAGLLKDEKELERLIHALSEALADIPTPGGRPFGQLLGRLKWPATGSLRVRYGAPRRGGSMRWQGVVIGAREGAPVRAVAGGRVAFADWLRGYGLLIIIDHGDGYMSLYGYNQALYKETGDWVEAGEVIAGVGNSGGRARDGLYFEIRHNGKPTNPARWCRLASR